MKEQKNIILHTFREMNHEEKFIVTHSSNDYTQDKFMERVSIAAYASPGLKFQWFCQYRIDSPPPSLSPPLAKY